jgi:hypothetical protein
VNLSNNKIKNMGILKLPPCKLVRLHGVLFKMGGGTSALQDMEELITCTFLLGRAVSAMSFPGNYETHVKQSSGLHAQATVQTDF